MSEVMHFSPGQRWFSDTESDLGLGTVIEANNRQVSILFPSNGEVRVYATASAPLTRLTLQPGDVVGSHQGWNLEIADIREQGNLFIFYGTRTDNGEQAELRETLIDHQLKLSKPQQRLFSGQYDSPKWFDLRQQCLQYQFNHSTSPLLGFVGARVDLIPHQLHIARSVGQRHAPRVLLADEVGLGKTIEAALIIHQQVLSGRASRILIVVPNSLVHQWLVEMLRRVNLSFSIFDEERLEAVAEEGGNPFEDEQRVICSLDFLTHNSRYYQQALEADWDLMVVDEAHHLRWSEGEPSQEYSVVEGLARKTPGVLLLTATPDQLGHESHFARLRLLDPKRFHSYKKFIKEEQGYTKLAKAIEPLLSGEVPNEKQFKAIAPFVGNQTELMDNLDEAKAREHLIMHILDCHGTGRLLFRNSRAGISGFPQRQLCKYPLPMPAHYQAMETNDLNLLMTPERDSRFANTWLQFDPRVEWLVTQLTELRPNKVLCICAHARSAMQLADLLKTKHAVRAAVFHEGMSIVERDKAAAYFAQQQDGAQVLICSEIGSEGRNFQFAHHMVLFDLPLVPDLLEQRIGRLDRIGQRFDIKIHVPYFARSASKVLLDWYEKGLQAFEFTCPTGNAVHEQVQEQLQQALLNPQDETMLNELIAQTAQLHQQFKQQLEQGRDKLLELNSSGKGQIESFIKRIQGQDENGRLADFMTSLFDAVGVIQEEKDEHSYLLRPGESMLSQLPGLDEEGMTITYSRKAALSMEQIQFLTNDHPMVQHAMDMVLMEPVGKSSMALTKNRELPVGYFWLDCLFVVSCNAARHLQPARFLPPTPVRICVDINGVVDAPQFQGLRKVNKQIGKQLLAALQPQIQQSLEHAISAGDTEAEDVRIHAQNDMQRILGDELQRLKALAELNPAIREEEIHALAEQIALLDVEINQAKVELEAVRLIVNTHQ
ncbi:RNA polymerase-associated protein RapA [Bowmanella sp. JS7-9]|uniref:RNA polymerase-associated protein RapA n=1 Tax=Pseudobowmanella zhangzhouensis TaxID=1537679 RepID=A0ABW1XKY3_9ALTE|nr:RNA polymerase-associated protein RapA [Bowmanella sp. JS7-9]TBX21513.1 ATP-dependent helicase [Bowmanella sp. JS7-9]